MEEILFRIVIIGDSSVGKSCIMLKIIEEPFENQHKPTIGVEFGHKILNIKDNLIKIQIWDTAGQEGYRSITRSFYRIADGVFIVYDVGSKKSFENCEFWLKEIKNNSVADTVIYLLGNQNDLEAENNIRERKVECLDGEQFAQKHPQKMEMALKKPQWICVTYFIIDERKKII